MKNKLLLIIGCAVIALSAIFLILYLVNSGLFAKPYNPPGALTTEIKLSDLGLICTPKVRHIWRCIFLWAKQEEKTKRTRQNSKSML